MKKVLPVVLLFSLVFATVVGQFVMASWNTNTPVIVAAPTSIEQALKTAEVLDADGDSVGSCFPVAKAFDCVALVSCKHVVVDPTPVAIRLPNGDLAPIICMVANIDVDVAVIWIRSNPHLPISPLPLSDAPAPSTGTRAMLAGYPLEQGLWVSEGLIGSPAERWGGMWTSVPIYYGCSGGPMLVDGRVIGVASGILVDPKRRQAVSTVSYVITVNSFREWLDKVLRIDPTGK